MGVPFEALIPYVIMAGMFGFVGGSLATVKQWTNNGKRPRFRTDRWDRQMMARDLRLTGKFREQSHIVEAPEGFEVNSQWKTEREII